MNLRHYCAFLLLTIYTVNAEAQGRILGYLIGEGNASINIMSGPGNHYSKVRSEKTGKAVYITPGKGEWYKVSLLASKGFIGYLHWKNVAVWTPNYGEYEELCKYLVTDPDGYVNVRKDTNSFSPIVRTLNTGVHFLGKTAVNTENWIGVFDNKGFLIGYVYSKRVRKLKETIPPFGSN